MSDAHCRYRTLREKLLAAGLSRLIICAVDQMTPEDATKIAERLLRDFPAERIRRTNQIAERLS